MWLGHTNTSSIWHYRLSVSYALSFASLTQHLTMAVRMLKTLRFHPLENSSLQPKFKMKLGNARMAATSPNTTGQLSSATSISMEFMVVTLGLGSFVQGGTTSMAII